MPIRYGQRFSKSGGTEAWGARGSPEDRGLGEHVGFTPGTALCSQQRCFPLEPA